MRPCLLSLALIASVGPAGQSLQTPIERAPGHLLIDAVAVDRNGRPVSDLKREELEVWIGGYRVPIETFTAVTPGSDERRGRAIILILDDLTLEPAVVPRVRDVARRFVQTMVAGDQIAIVTLSRPSIENASGPVQLLKNIDAYGVRASGVLQRDRLGEQVLRTIGSLSRQFAEAGGRRKTIVAIGAGWLFDTPIPPPSMGRDLRAEWTDAMRALASANVTLYVVDPAGVGTSRIDSGSSGFARETGGQAFLNTNDLNGAADRIMAEAGTYYLLGVADPPVGRKADLRELDVRVLRRGVSVRARKAIPGSN